MVYLPGLSLAKLTTTLTGIFGIFRRFPLPEKRDVQKEYADPGL
jgi:hypothetical protein